jgi:hypothetical protein
MIGVRFSAPAPIEQSQYAWGFSIGMRLDIELRSANVMNPDQIEIIFLIVH